MSRLDDAIADVAYVLDSLMTLRTINDDFCSSGRRKDEDN